MVFKSIIGTLSICLAVVSFNANATLIGDTINSSGSGLNPASATIDNTIEFAGIIGWLNFDFGANTLTVTNTDTNTAPISWGGWGDYIFSDFDSSITGLSILSNVGFTGSIINNFSFTDSSITLDMLSGGADVGGQLVYLIETGPSLPVPEPSIVWLLFSGLAIMGFARRKKV
ncbi:MAG: PEP-CTERM sorting domain-containing protein [Proteobacteria bacterium]|nr:PEP-CTERM sorting domain-containing protein [Pseudomonadota bacterium]